MSLLSALCINDRQRDSELELFPKTEEIQPWPQAGVLETQL